MTKDKNWPKKHDKDKFGIPSYVPPNKDKNPTPIKPSAPSPPPAQPSKKK